MSLSKKINLLQLAKLQAVLFGLIGLCFGIYYSIGGMFIDILVSSEVLSAEKWETPGLSIGTLMAYMALVAMPLFTAACGFVLGLVEGLLYNLFRKRLGKFDFNLFD
tara:strand:+ start:2438 stop:2758 length:321 start_codon:yes stop_codon:yes gene_type:complete